MADDAVRGVHLVGAINLDPVPAVFETVGRLLGQRVRRVPDGEPGSRRLWVTYQYPLLRAKTCFETIPDAPVYVAPRLRLRAGIDPATVSFGELGYSREARASYLDFCAARESGQLPPDCRMQVSLPTPLAVLYSFLDGPSRDAVEEAYTTAMVAEVDRICAAIPNEDLAIQWDLCHEMILWDGQLPDQMPERWPRPFSDIEGGVMQRVSRLAGAVPEPVELGFHLCYGDLDAHHFIDPQDTAKMGDLATAVARCTSRTLDWIHMPVLRSWTDPEVFRPLLAMELHPETELYLGLVHHEDGTEGARSRIEAARQVLPEFGIATECGMGRRSEEMVRELLEIHAGIG